MEIQVSWTGGQKLLDSRLSARLMDTETQEQMDTMARTCPALLLLHFSSMSWFERQQNEVPEEDEESLVPAGTGTHKDPSVLLPEWAWTTGLRL